MNLHQQQLQEQKRYRQLYGMCSHYGQYIHGKDFIDFFISKFNPKKVLDVGCGDNGFCKLMKVKSVKCVGVDFASPQADQIAFAHNLPFKNKSFEWIVAFDVMEHLLPNEIHDVLKEFVRIVSKGLVFSICYRLANTNHNDYLTDKRNLHLTVQPEKWWIEQLSQYIYVQKHKQYLYGLLNDS